MAKQKRIVAPARTFSFDEDVEPPTSAVLVHPPPEPPRVEMTPIVETTPESVQVEPVPPPLVAPSPQNGTSYPSSMDNLALVFLDDSISRRLAVAWMTCKGVEVNWFEAAGLVAAQHAEGKRLSRALRLNGVCREGGVTDPLALQYIQAVIAKPLAASKKGK